jgi:hypothetical protein
MVASIGLKSVIRTVRETPLRKREKPYWADLSDNTTCLSDVGDRK